MRIRINGEMLTEAKRIEISEEAPPMAAWGAVLAGIVAMVWWWQLW